MNVNISPGRKPCRYWQLRRAGSKMGGWFVKKEGYAPKLEPGEMFRHVRAGNFVETAKVLAIMKDGLGIPHVRFDMTVDTPSKIRLVEGRRILSLASFTQLYRERVPA